MSNSPPAHAEEHHDLMQLVAKVIKHSALIEGMVLITIGVDGRPCVGANIEDPAVISAILRELGNAEHTIEGVRRIGRPVSN